MNEFGVRNTVRMVLENVTCIARTRQPQDEYNKRMEDVIMDAVAKYKTSLIESAADIAVDILKRDDK